MAIGSKNAYATTQAPQDNILQSMQYVDQLDYRRKRDLALEEEAKKKAKAKQEEELAADLGKISSTITGNESFDAPALQAAEKYREGIFSKAKQYENGEISKLEYEQYKKKAFENVALLNQKAKFIIDKGIERSTLLKEGKIEPGTEEQALKFSEAFEKGKTFVEVDDNGNLNYMVYGTDEEGNPSEIIEKGGIADYGNFSFQTISKQNWNEDLKNFKANNPLDLTENISGMIKTGTKEISPRLDNQIKGYAQAKIKDKNAAISAYRNATGEVDYNIMENPEKLKVAEDWIYNTYKESYNKEITQDEALGRANLGLGYARLNKEDDPLATTTETEIDEQILTDDFTGNKVGKNTLHKNMIAVKGNNPKFKNLGGKKSGLNDGYVVGFVLGKDGRVGVVGKALIDKGQRFKVGNQTVGLEALQNLANQGNQEAQAVLDSYSTAGNYGRFIRVPSNSELESIATQSGYNSAEDLKSQLKTINNNPQEKPKSSGVSWK